MEDDTDYLNKKKIDILGENQENNNNESITNSDKIGNKILLLHYIQSFYKKQKIKSVQ